MNDDVMMYIFIQNTKCFDFGRLPAWTACRQVLERDKVHYGIADIGLAGACWGLRGAWDGMGMNEAKPDAV